MSGTAAGAAGSAGNPAPFTASNAYRNYVLGLLLTVGLCSWVDRQIFAVLLQSIKLEFSFTDTQLGLLGGVAFGLFYASVGLPIAWLADRVNRRNIIAVSLTVWSLMTALSGTATGFWSLFLCRMGVGIGEAGGSPPAQSLISDYFPPERRPFALGVLFMFIPLGFLTTFLLGGWLNEHFGWRAVFVLLGVPGLVLAVILRLTLREPPRGHSENLTRQAPPPTLGSTVRHFLRRPSLRHLPLGGAVHGIGAWAAGVWTLPYFVRVHGMSNYDAAFWFAFIFGIGGAGGAFLGGRFAAHVVQRTGDPRWYAWFSSVVLLATIPFQFFIYLWPSPTPALLMMFPAMFIMHMFLGPVTGTIQNLGGVRRRAMAAAFYLFLANLVAMTVGPLIVGVVSDTFHAQYGNEALRYGILVPVIVTSLWAAAHFYLAGRTLPADLAAANDD